MILPRNKTQYKHDIRDELVQNRNAYLSTYVSRKSSRQYKVVFLQCVAFKGSLIADGMLTLFHLKVAFFRKVRFVFSNLQISKRNIPKNYPELEI